MTVQEFQLLIERLYYEKDSGRGWQETFVWFVEEVGELGRALRSEGRPEIEAEFADALNVCGRHDLLEVMMLKIREHSLKLTLMMIINV